MNVGIDIGTSYSSTAIIGEDGKAEPIKVANGPCAFGDSYSMPSAVFVDDTNILIGQIAMSSKVKNPSSFKNEFKRDLGQVIPYSLGQLKLLPEDLYKEFFIHFKECAENAGGKKISKTYITYPANFNKKKQDLIRLAAKKAGFLDVELIDEPTAAAYSYCSKGKIKEGDKLLVYDLGGGTFDVALIQYISGEFEPITQSLGIDKCGGMDIDNMIFNDIYSSIPQEIIDRILESELAIKRTKARLYELSVEVKHQLSTMEVYDNAIPVGYECFDYRITRGKLNNMIAPLVEETLDKVKKIVETANLSMNEVDTVLIVGGSSRIPYIKEKLKEITGKDANKDIDPELAICMGAALWEEDIIADDNTRYDGHIDSNDEGPIDINVKPEEYRRTEKDKMSAEEQCRLACNYLNGDNGYEKDYEKALYWLVKAAEHGEVNAQLLLGNCYAKGLGIEQDENKAVKWYRKAADKDVAGAQFLLGNCYYKGQGLKKDYNTAGIMWERAANQGHKEAKKSLKLLEIDFSGKYIKKQTIINPLNDSSHDQISAKKQYELGNEPSSGDKDSWYKDTPLSRFFSLYEEDSYTTNDEVSGFKDTPLYRSFRIFLKNNKNQ